MKFGLLIPLAAPYATRQYIELLGRLAESHGFDSLWVGEHVVVPTQAKSEYPSSADGKMPSAVEDGELDPYTTLSYLAALTHRIRLGACTIVPQRNPVYMAKEIANVDWLSGGRIDFGAGIGWSQDEFEAVGARFEKRGERCLSYLKLMRDLWTQRATSCDNEYYRMPECRLYPKPLQNPHPPIHVLGASSGAIMRVAEVGDGFFPMDQSPEQMSTLVKKLEAALEAKGRERSAVTVSVTPYLSDCDLEKVEQYRAAGVDQVVLFRFVEDVRELEGIVSQFARTLVEPGRAI